MGCAHASVQRYVYDDLGRLKVAGGARAATRFVYDRSGNRTKRMTGPLVGRVLSDCFDPDFYLAAYQDILLAGVEPHDHFTQQGWREHRDPSAYFDYQGYLNRYPDIAAGGINALDHYSQSGWREGRNPSGLFNTNRYLSAYPDIAAAGINPLLHFLQSGLDEGRAPQGDGTFD